MNFRDLEYFSQLVREKNFTKVAKIFQVSQPTVTYAIQRLEKEMNAQLITRDQSHHQIDLTPAGEVLSHYAESILHEYASAKKAVQAMSKEKIRFSLPPIIGNYYFPMISAELIKNHLLQSFELVEGGSRDLFQLFKEGKIDMGLIGSIRPIRESFIHSKVIAEKKFVIVVHKEHPMAKRASIRFEELENESFLTLNEHYIHSLALKEFAAQAHIHPTIAYQSTDLATLKSMIRVGVGIGFFTELAILPADELVSIPLANDNQPTFMISLLRNHEMPKSELYMEVIRVLSEIFRSEIN